MSKHPTVLENRYDYLILNTKSNRSNHVITINNLSKINDQYLTSSIRYTHPLSKKISKFKYNNWNNYNNNALTSSSSIATTTTSINVNNNHNYSDIIHLYQCEFDIQKLKITDTTDGILNTDLMTMQDSSNNILFEIIISFQQYRY